MMTFKVQPASKRMSVQSFLQRSLMMMAAIMAALVTFVACDDDDKNSVEVESVTINQPAADVELVAGGSSITLSVTIEPANATNKTVTWSSSDNTIATVSSGGVVTGLKPGTVTITATTKSGNKSDNITLTVKANGNSGVANKRIKTWVQSSSNAADYVRAEFSYNSNGTIKQTDFYDQSSNRTQYSVFTTNPDGTLAKFVLHYEGNTYQTEYEYFYDSQKVLQNARVSFLDNLLNTVEYTFENGRKIREVFKNPSGSITQQFEYKYGSNGRRTTTTETAYVPQMIVREFTRTYNSDGTIQKVTFSFEDRPVTIIFTYEDEKPPYDEDIYANW